MLILFLYMRRLKPKFTLFPYTTLFRSRKKINEITREDIKDKYIDHLKIHQGELDERRKRKLETIVREYIKERQKNGDRKSTRLNSSHVAISYAVFCLKKKI